VHHFAITITKTTIDLTVDPIALLAFITATASFVLSIIALKRDRANIKIEKREGWILFDPNTKQKSDPKLCVSVTNNGRRPAYLSNVGGILLRQKGGFIFSDSVINGTIKLDEGQAFDGTMPQKTYEEHLKNEVVDALVVRVSTGKEYRLHVAPFYKRYYYALLKRTKMSSTKPKKDEQV
jgi:hypothetical protein